MPKSKEAIIRSNASGVITCTAPNKDVIETLINVLSLAQDFYYATEITKKGTIQRIHNEFFHDDFYVVNLSFFADGRNEYLWNIQNLCQLLEEELTEKGMLEELKTLEANHWSLGFNFCDDNMDENFLYEALAVIDHKWETKLSQSRFTLEMRNDYVPSWGNLLKICDYDINWILDPLEGVNKEDLADIITENLDSLCFYYDCSIQQLFLKLPKLSKLFDEAMLAKENN